MKIDLKIEAELKNKTGTVSRIIEETSKAGKCIICGENVKTIAHIAKNY